MKIRRLLLLLLSLAVLMTMSVMPAFADSLPDYSGQTTVQFAKDNFEKDGDNNWTGDCVVYARMCLEAGGVPRNNNVKGYSSGQYGNYLERNGYAEKFTLAVNSKGRVTVKGNEGKIAPGDLLVNYCLNPDCPKPAFHASVITGIEGSYWMQYHHSRSGHPGYGYCQTYRCSKCGADKSQTIVLCYHIRSAENGYFDYTEAVSGVAAARKSYNQIRLTWNKLPSATVGYDVYCKYSNAEKYIHAATMDPNTCEYTLTIKNTKKYGQDVQFYVVPLRFSPGGGEAQMGKASAVVSAYTTPNLPTKAKAKRLSKTSVKVTWTKGKGTTGCKIEYRYGGTKTWIKAGTTTKTKFTIKKLKKNKKIYIRITPYCKGTAGVKYRDKGRIISCK